MTDLCKCEAVACTANRKFEFRDNVVNQTEWPHSWPHGELSYRLNNLSEDFDKKWQPLAVTQALMAWQYKIKHLKFRRERNPDAHVNINVNFSPQSTFSSAGVLAHAVYPGQGEASGDCEINDEGWDWVASIRDSNMGHPPLVPVLIHEFGHSIGLTHAVEYPLHTSDIMYPSFDLGQKKNTIGPFSTGRAQDRYGARNMNQRIIDMLIRRRNLGTIFRN